MEDLPVITCVVESYFEFSVDTLSLSYTDATMKEAPDIISHENFMHNLCTGSAQLAIIHILIL